MDKNKIHLSTKDSEKYISATNNPPEPSEHLKEAAKKYKCSREVLNEARNKPMEVVKTINVEVIKDSSTGKTKTYVRFENGDWLESFLIGHLGPLKKEEKFLEEKYQNLQEDK